MTLQEALKYNGKAIGFVKGTYAIIYDRMPSGKMQAVYPIRKNWVHENYYKKKYVVPELKQYAELCSSSKTPASVAFTKDGGMQLVGDCTIVYTDDEMQQEGKMRECYLLDNAIKVVDTAVERTIEKPKSGDPLEKYQGVFETIRGQFEFVGKPVIFVNEAAIDWMPDTTVDYEAEYRAAKKEAERLRNLLIAAGAASLI